MSTFVVVILILLESNFSQKQHFKFACFKRSLSGHVGTTFSRLVLCLVIAYLVLAIGDVQDVVSH